MAEPFVEQLHSVLSAVGTEEEAKRFVEAVLSPDEVAKLSSRLEIMRLLYLGFTRAQIRVRLGEVMPAPSAATVSRANTVVKYGDPIVRELLERCGRA